MLCRPWLISIITLLGCAPLYADGGLPAGAVEVRLVGQPAVSPDGKAIVFEWREDLWTVDSNGGRATRLTQHPAFDTSPKFSPDGKTLYFTSNRSGANQLFSMPVGGGPATQHTFHSEGVTLQDISPDGHTALVLATRDFDNVRPQRLLEVNLQKDAPERLCFDAPASMASYSSDGSAILFCSDGEGLYRKGYRGSKASSIWRFQRDSLAISALAQNDSESRWPMPNKDSSAFYYVSESSGTFNLHLKSFTGDSDKALTSFKDDGVMFPTLSKDGSTIVFRRGVDLWSYHPGGEPQPFKIWAIGDFPDMTQEARKITGTNDAAFSNSGLEIAFSAEGELFAMDTVLREPNRLTETPAYESDVSFSKDGTWVYYRQDDGLTANYWRMKCRKKGEYWWKAKSFEREAVTKGPTVKEQLALSPDNKHIAYVSDYGKLCVSLADGSNERVIHTSTGTPSFDWSPDSKWLVYTASDENYNADIFIAPIDGSREPFDLSRHPDNESVPKWSSDGRMIAFIGRRLNNRPGIYQVYLQLADDLRSPRERKEQEAVTAMRDDPLYRLQPDAPAAAPSAPSSTGAPATKPTLPAAQPDTTKPAVPAAAPDSEPNKPQSAESKDSGEPTDSPKKNEAKEKPVEVKIDFADLSERIRKLDSGSIEPGTLMWSADSKAIFFQSLNSKEKTLHRLEIKDGASPTLAFAQRGSLLREDKKENLYWIVDGSPAVLSKGKLTTHSIEARIVADRCAQERLYFRMIWRLLRDRFYDPRLNGLDWNAVLTKYENLAAAANSGHEFDRLVNMMTGELNASHLGFRSNTWPAPWTDDSAEFRITRHTGLRLDHGNGSGPLKVASMIPNSPAAYAQPPIQAGDVIVAVDGRQVDASMPDPSFLNGRPSSVVNFTIRDTAGKEREVELKPISWATARELAGDAIIAARRKTVEQQSQGKLGYIHVARMNWDEFEEFERQIFSAGHGKDGLVIDVRDNGGGSTTDHLLTVLCQPQHAVTVDREGGMGYPQDRMVYASWNKPIVVLCNQHSFSNAEVFSHAIKTLNRGPLIGIPTAGGVISTADIRLLDAGTMRLPFRGWFVPGTGKDMELNGAMPDFIVARDPNDLAKGRDPQLTKAIEVLEFNLREAAKQAKPFQPIYRYAPQTR